MDYVSTLGDFWIALPESKKNAFNDIFTNVAIKAQDIDFYAKQIILARSLLTAGILPLRRISFYPITVEDYQEGQTEIPVDYNLVSFVQLQDKIHSPTLTIDNTQAEVIADFRDKTRKIVLNNPLSSSFVGKTFKLWATKAYFYDDILHQYKLFAPYLKENINDMKDFAFKLEGIYLSLLASLSKESLRLGLSLLFGFPVAKTTGMIIRETRDELEDSAGNIYKCPTKNVMFTVHQGQQVQVYDVLTNAIDIDKYLSGWMYWRPIYLWTTQDYPDGSTMKIDHLIFRDKWDSVRVFDDAGNRLDCKKEIIDPEHMSLAVTLPPMEKKLRVTYFMYYDNDNVLEDFDEEFVYKDAFSVGDIFKMGDERLVNDVIEEDNPEPIRKIHPLRSFIKILIDKSLLPHILNIDYREFLNRLVSPAEHAVLTYVHEEEEDMRRSTLQHAGGKSTTDDEWQLALEVEGPGDLFNINARCTSDNLTATSQIRLTIDGVELYLYELAAKDTLYFVGAVSDTVDPSNINGMVTVPTTLNHPFSTSLKVEVRADDPDDKTEITCNISYGLEI